MEKHPKLSFVITCLTTSTLSTTISIPYIRTTARFGEGCTGSKRRAFNFDGASADESELKLSQLKEDVQSSREGRKMDREGRFLLYWITTTSISTSTSFTTTFSVTKVSCTPAGASLCG